MVSKLKKEGCKRTDLLSNLAITQERNSINSLVVNTSICDCFLKCESLDHRGKNSLKARARYATSFSSGINFNALLISSLYSLLSTKITLLFNEEIILSK